MADEAVVTAPAPAPGTSKTPITETEEFKQERERMRLNFEAEYRRKTQELEAQSPKTVPSAPTNGRDFYDDWGERHGLPAEAARELVQGVVGYVHTTMLPTALGPITIAQKRQELRAQRTELRSSNPKLAKLDDRYHAEALKMLEGLRPEQVGVDSYAKALQMVIGGHIEEIESDRVEADKTVETRNAEPVPGPEPLPSSGSSKPTKVTLNKDQQAFCEERGFSPEDFVTMMRDRARKLEASGLTKVQVRERLRSGNLLGAIEF